MEIVGFSAQILSSTEPKRVWPRSIAKHTKITALKRHCEPFVVLPMARDVCGTNAASVFLDFDILMAL